MPIFCKTAFLVVSNIIGKYDWGICVSPSLKVPWVLNTASTKSLFLLGSRIPLERAPFWWQIGYKYDDTMAVLAPKASIVMLALKATLQTWSDNHQMINWSDNAICATPFMLLNQTMSFVQFQSKVLASLMYVVHRPGKFILRSSILRGCHHHHQHDEEDTEA